MRFVRPCNKVALRRSQFVNFALLTAITLSLSARLPAQFSDEFDGVSGKSLDSSKWSAEIGGGGWGNEELQFYTGDIENVRLDGRGNLEIRAAPIGSNTDLTCWYGKCRFTSARLVTKGKFSFRYGRVEARIKVPDGEGVWPAFWMLGDDIEKTGWPGCGEIDVMEFIGRQPSAVYGTVHGPGYSGAAGISRSTTIPDLDKVSSDFHVFAVEWSNSQIEWFLDGRKYGSVSRNDVPRGAKWVFDRPFFIILNFAVGGKWPGAPGPTTQFPQSMLVDYVRVTPIKVAAKDR